MHCTHLPLPLRCLAPLLAALAPLCLVGCGEPEQRGAPESRVAAAPGSLDEWREHREKLDETVWAKERLADRHESAIVAMWDALLSADRLGRPEAVVEVLASLGFDQIVLGTPRQVESLEHGIEVWRFEEPHQTLDRAGWGAWLRKLSDAGYRLVQSDWHHLRFQPAEAAEPARSRVSFTMHLLDAEADRRLAVDGEIGVEWSGRSDSDGVPIPARVDASGVRMLARAGAAGFERILSYLPPASRRVLGIHPVAVYDLDADGLSDIAMVNCSRVLWNQGEGKFHDAPLVEHPYWLTETAVIGDVNGDSYPDLLSTRARGEIVVYFGNAKGRFSDEPVVPQLDAPLRAPAAMTLGDIDADGDLDLWLAQYKPAYRGGQMPSPFYDANDGYPAYLLLNDGNGNFTDGTEQAGLAARRNRRTYASSFVDLDGDGDLDLLVVSDYSGIDLYHNDGTGHFSDANATVRGDRHLFGMSSAFGDYNLDGRLDFFVAGMSSTTARRLEALDLAPEDRPDIRAMRMRMAWGNRMYLASDQGWVEPEFAASVARTGWTWGTTAFDFDNDGDPDIFAANGHITGESTKDYCTNFWCYDIFDGTSEQNPELDKLFAEKMKGLNAGIESWDGRQKNNLLMNRAGNGFVNVAFLLGVGDEFDSRSALSDDLDADGRVDLVVVEDNANKGQKLHVYLNRLETGNDWIGVRLREEGDGKSPVGAKVSVRTPDRTFVRQILTGETLMGQHSTTVHFGLGKNRSVDSIEVRWIDGTTRTLLRPQSGRYHSLLASDAR